MSANTLLASAPTLDGISESITQFYCGESKRLEPEADRHNAWIVVGSNGNPLIGVRVVKRGRRYRFEMVI